MIDDRATTLREWNKKCPKCGSDIHFTLRGSKLGTAASARCGRHLESTRIFDVKKLREGRIKFCRWEGYAVRMWDGSVRFKEKNGRWLIEWR